MPTPRPLTKAQITRLSRLPRLPDLILEGGMRMLPVFVRDEGETFQPRVALWVDAHTFLVRGSAVTGPPRNDGIAETLKSLVAAFTTPLPAPPAAVIEGLRSLTGGPGGQEQAPLPISQPGLPSRIRVDDETLAAAARIFLAPLDIAVDFVEALPALEEAFAAMAAAMGGDPDAGPPEPFSWTIDAALLPSLYRAAADYARRAPWTYMPDQPPLAVTLGVYGPQDDVPTLYACILGGGGEVRGVALYYSLDALHQAAHQGAALADADDLLLPAMDLLQQAGGPLAPLPAGELRALAASLLGQEESAVAGENQALQDSLVLFLDSPQETDPTYLEWLAAHGIAPSARQDVPVFYRTSPGAEPRVPDAREVVALTAALAALNGFFGQHHRTLAGPVLPAEGLSHRTAVTTVQGMAEATVTFPAPGYAWEDEDEWEEDAVQEDGVSSAATPSTALYRFQVKLQWRKSTWRRIELRGDQTLHDLHRAIQRAFGWDDDHLYAFFLSGKAWDHTSEYASPYGEGGRPANHAHLEQVPLTVGRPFLYIFDFGDELRHLVKLEAITPGGVQEGVQYPRITESRGASVPQYGDPDAE